MPEVTATPEIPTTPTPEVHQPPTNSTPDRPQNPSLFGTWGRRLGLVQDGSAVHTPDTPAAPVPAEHVHPTVDTTSPHPMPSEASAVVHTPSEHAEASSGDAPVPSAEAPDQPDTTAATGTEQRTEKMIEVNGHQYPAMIEYRVHNAEYRRDDPTNIDFRRYDLEKLLRDIKQRELDAAAGVHVEPTEWDKQDEQTVAYCLDTGLLEKNADGILQIVEAKTPSTVGVPRKEYFSAPDPKDVYKGTEAARFLNTTTFGWIELKARLGEQGNPADEKIADLEETRRRQHGRLAAHVIEEPNRKKTWSGERVVFDEHTNKIVDEKGEPLPYGSPKTPIFEVRQNELAIYTGKEEPVTYPNEQLQKDVIGVPLSKYTELLVTLPNGETGALVIGTKRNLPMPDVSPRTWLSSMGSSSETPEKNSSSLDTSSDEGIVAAGSSTETTSSPEAEARVDVLPPLDPPLPERVDTLKKSPGWKLWVKNKWKGIAGGITAVTIGLSTIQGGGGSGPRVETPHVPMPHNPDTTLTLDAVPSAKGELPKPAGGAAVPMPEIGGPKDLGKTPPPAEEVASGMEKPIESPATPRKTVEYRWDEGDPRNVQGFIDARKGVAYLLATGRSNELHDLGLTDETIKALENHEPVKVELDLTNASINEKLAQVLKPLREDDATPENKEINARFDAYAREQIKTLNGDSVIGADGNFTEGSIKFVPEGEAGDNLRQKMAEASSARVGGV